MMENVRALRVLVACLLVCVPLSSPAFGSASPTVVVLNLSGVVDPFEASYLTSQIAAAEREGADAVLLTIDTPGGLDSSMRQIIQSILNSEVPIICYVSPEGARAASAGAFILTACHIAAMAPGTNVGAASPVGVTGAVEQKKVTNDAVAYIRSLAERRGRNPGWAAQAVRNARSSSAEEAVRLGVIDVMATTERQLLSKVDGRSVEVRGGTVHLETAGARLLERNLGIGSSLLHALFTPELAFIFFYLGLALLVVEFLHPGLSVPGVVGVLCLLAAFSAFGMLPVSLIGIVLLAASVAFFLLELKHPGLGVPAIGGLATLVVGGLLLFDRAATGARVSLWAIAPVAVIVAVFFAFAVPGALRARHLPPRTGRERLLGAVGVATTDLNPRGSAQIASERWSVESIGGAVARGEHVRVVEAEGLRLKVEPANQAGAAHSTSEERRGA
jgi:membrane-bound serine protease (ClpP class)